MLNPVFNSDSFVAVLDKLFDLIPETVLIVDVEETIIRSINDIPLTDDFLPRYVPEVLELLHLPFLVYNTTSYKDLPDNCLIHCSLADRLDIPRSITFPPSLKTLNIAGSSCGKVNWSDLINLTNVDMHDNDCVSYSITFPPSLKTLNIAGSSCGKVNWSDLINLTNVDMHDNDCVSYSITFPPSLKTLNIAGSYCGQVNWSDLINLTNIDMHDNDCVSYSITFPPSLEYLMMYNSSCQTINVRDLVNLKTLNHQPVRASLTHPPNP